MYGRTNGIVSSDTVLCGSVATKQKTMADYDRLPGWLRNILAYASYDITAHDVLMRSRMVIRLYGEHAYRGIVEKALLDNEAALAVEIGRPVMGRRDGPIAEWSGLRTREARKGAMRLRGQP